MKTSRQITIIIIIIIIIIGLPQFFHASMGWTAHTGR